jgi:hypothetical protein
MAKSKMDPVHMLQESYDEATQSFNMQLKNLEMAIELSAADGDSVLTQPQMLELKVTAGDIIDTSKYTKICALGASTLVSAVMSDSVEIELPALPQGAVVAICVPKIKVMSDCYIILQS